MYTCCIVECFDELLRGLSLLIKPSRRPFEHLGMVPSLVSDVSMSLVKYVFVVGMVVQGPLRNSRPSRTSTCPVERCNICKVRADTPGGLRGTSPLAIATTKRCQFDFLEDTSSAERRVNGQIL